MVVSLAGQGEGGLVAICQRSISAFQAVLMFETLHVAEGKEKGCTILKHFQVGTPTVSLGWIKLMVYESGGLWATEAYRLMWGQGLKLLSSSVAG